jgi:hypothetical protein
MAGCLGELEVLAAEDVDVLVQSANNRRGNAERANRLVRVSGTHGSPRKHGRSSNWSQA